MPNKRMLKAVAAVCTKFPALGNAAEVERLIRFVLAAWRKARPRVDPELGDDMRDILSWGDYLVPLSKSDLRLIAGGKRSDVKRWAKKGEAPFSKLNKRARGFFSTQLSGRLIVKVARYRLYWLENNVPF